MKDSTKNVLVVLIVLVTGIFVAVVAPKGKLSSHDKLLEDVGKKVAAGNHYVDGKILETRLDENKQSAQLKMVQDQITALVLLFDQKTVLDRLDLVESLNERLAGIEFQVASLLDNNQTNKDCGAAIEQFRKDLELVKNQIVELSKKEKSVVTKRTYVCPCNPCR